MTLFLNCKILAGSNACYVDIHVGYLMLLYQLQKFMKGKMLDSADNTLRRITESSASTASILRWDSKHGFPKSINSAPYLGYEHKPG
jgi:hypothetical protein